MTNLVASWIWRICTWENCQLLLHFSLYNDCRADFWGWLHRAWTCTVWYNGKLKPLPGEFKGMIDAMITDIRQLDGVVDQWSQWCHLSGKIDSFWGRLPGVKEWHTHECTYRVMPHTHDMSEWHTHECTHTNECTPRVMPHTHDMSEWHTNECTPRVTPDTWLFLISPDRRNHLSGKRGEVGGWGRVPFLRNLMSPTPRRKWYLTTGRRAH